MNLDKTLLNKQVYYGEVGQLMELKFSFVNKVGENELKSRYPLVRCRDFMADDLYISHKPDCRFKIYGFEAPEHPIDFDATRLLIQSPSYSWNKNLLQDVHDFYGQPQYKLVELEKGLWYLESSNYWIKNTVMFAWYVFLLKRCLEPKNSHYTLETMFSGVRDWENYEFRIDYTHMLQAMKKLPDLGVSNVKEEYAKNSSTVHNYSGFISCLKSPQFTIYGDTLKKIISNLAKNKDKKQCDAKLATQI